MNSPTCKLLADCVNCTSQENNLFYQLKLIKGYSFQQYRHKQNELLFIMSGQIRISSLNGVDILVSEGQILSLPESVEIDITILEDVNCLVYVWSENDFLCEEQYRILMETLPDEAVWNALGIIPPLRNFVDAVILNLENGVSCHFFWTIKEQEFMLLMNRYYTKQELLNLMAPALQSMNRFRMFVQHNYYKVKTVEELALLGGYGAVSFRRLFKEEYGESAYRWMNRQKQEHILYDLKYRNATISEISYKYQFESLSQFSNFCKKYFGKSPREIMKENKNSSFVKK